jgi:hypothetical protein
MAALVISLAITWASLLNAAWVGWSFGTGHHRFIFPVRLLGVLVAFSTTIGFIPLLEQLVVAAVDPQSLVVGEAEAVALQVASGMSAALFVPFALIGSLLVFDAEPLGTGSPLRAPNGGVNFISTAVRCVLVLLSAYNPNASDSGWLVPSLHLILSGSLAALYIMQMPHYTMWANQLQAALYVSLAWIALGSILVRNARTGFPDWFSAEAEGAALQVALPWLAVTPVFFLVAWRAVYLSQYMFLSKGVAFAQELARIHVERLRHSVPTAASELPVNSSVRFTEKQGSQRTFAFAGGHKPGAPSGPVQPPPLTHGASLSSLPQSENGESMEIISPAGALSPPGAAPSPAVVDEADGKHLPAPQVIDEETDETRPHLAGDNSLRKGLPSAGVAVRVARIAGKGMHAIANRRRLKMTGQSGRDFKHKGGTAPPNASKRAPSAGKDPQQASSSSVFGSAAQMSDVVAACREHLDIIACTPMEPLDPPVEFVIASVLLRAFKCLHRTCCPRSRKRAAMVIDESAEETPMIEHKDGDKASVLSSVIASQATIEAGKHATDIVVNMSPSVAGTAATVAGRRAVNHSRRSLDFLAGNTAREEHALQMVVADSLRARRMVATTMTSSIAIELLARACLAEPSLPWGVRLAMTEVLFETGMRCFDVSYVRIAFARYVEALYDDTNRALGLLADASRRNPGVADRFAVFQRLRQAEQSRHATALGKSGGVMDSAGFLEFRKLEREATAAHLRSLAYLRKIWHHISRVSPTGNNESIARALARRLRGLQEQSAKATHAYTRLLAKHPRATTLLRQFGAFLLEVRNRPQGAELIFARADDIEDEDSRVAINADNRSADGGNSAAQKSKTTDSFLGGGSAKFSAAMEGGGMEEAALFQRQTFRIRDDDFRAVEELRRGVTWGVVAMALLMLAMFCVTIVMMSTFQLSVTEMFQSASRRLKMGDILLNARGLQIGSHLNDSRVLLQYEQELSTAATNLSVLHAKLRATEGFPLISFFMRAWPVNILESRRVEGTNVVTAPRLTNLADAVYDVVYCANRLVAYSQKGQLDRLQFPGVVGNADWRLIADNVHQTLIGTLAIATKIYVFNQSSLAQMFHAIQGTLLGTMLLINFVIYFIIYLPAASRVAHRSVTLSDLVGPAASLGVAKVLEQVYRRAEKRIKGEDGDAQDEDFSDEEGHEEQDDEGKPKEPSSGEDKVQAASPLVLEDKPKTKSESKRRGRDSDSDESRGRSRSRRRDHDSDDDASDDDASDSDDDRRHKKNKSKKKGKKGRRDSTADLGVLDDLISPPSDDDVSSQASDDQDSDSDDSRRHKKKQKGGRRASLIRKRGTLEKARKKAKEKEEKAKAEKAAADTRPASKSDSPKNADRDDSGSDSDTRKAKMQRKRDSPNAKLVSRISRSMAALLLMIAGLQSFTFWTAYSSTEQARLEGFELASASDRADSLQAAGMFVRELAVGDHQLGRPLELLYEAKTQVDVSRYLHDAIRFGNGRLGIKGSDNRYKSLGLLMYGKRANGIQLAALNVTNMTISADMTSVGVLRTVKSEISALIDLEGFSSVTSRYNAEVVRYLDSVAQNMNVRLNGTEAPLERILRLRDVAKVEKLYAVEGDVRRQLAQNDDTTEQRAFMLQKVNDTGYTAGTYGYNLREMLREQSLRFVLAANDGPLNEAADAAAALYRDESSKAVSGEIMVQAGFLVANLVVLFALYWLGLRVAIKSLLLEASMSHSFLDLIPIEVLESNPDHKIVSFFLSADQDEDDLPRADGAPAGTPAPPPPGAAPGAPPV